MSKDSKRNRVIEQKPIKMHYLKYGCGIDMAKDKFDVCIGLKSIEQDFQKVSSMQFNNTPAGFAQYHNWVKKHCKHPVPIIHAMEATGVYHEGLALFLDNKGMHVCVVLPNKANKYKQSLGLKSKTDNIDAFALSKMACEQTLKKWKAPGPTIYALRLMTRQIESITALGTIAKNQLEALTHGMFGNKQVEKLLKKQVVFYDKQKAELLESIQDIINSDAELKIKFEYIGKIKGVGVLTIATIIAETNGFELFESAAQLVSYAGYDVIADQSGKHVGKTKISKKGNSRIRRCLHFPALNAVHYKVHPFVQLYDRVYKRTNIKMKGYTAVQKKMLIIIYALWKRNQAFNENHKPCQDKTSEEKEKEPTFVFASQKQHDRKKVAPAKARATQDKHPSKYRSMPSFV